MTTYSLPSEPSASRVWLLDHPEYGGPLVAERTQHGPWALHVHGRVEEYSFGELLGFGDITDEDPHDVSWLYGPWHVGHADHQVVMDVYGHHLFEVEGSWTASIDDRAAALIVQLVNAHIAARSGGAT